MNIRVDRLVLRPLRVWFRSLTALVVIVGAGACVPGEGEIPQMASPLLRCPETQISVVSLGVLVRRADGCGLSKFYVQTWRGWEDARQVENRASFDLGCPVDRLSLTSLSETGLQIGVAGCERRAVYTYVQTGLGTWDWILDSRTNYDRGPGALNAPSAEPAGSGSWSSTR